LTCGRLAGCSDSGKETIVDSTHLEKQFARIGATLVVRPMSPQRYPNTRRYDVNVLTDPKLGEYFVISATTDAPDMRVLNADPDDRHLVLHIAGAEGGERFLCGHDERHWFAAAVAGRVTTVRDAKRSLLPKELREAGLSDRTVNTRHNEAFKRQGEWFFVPIDRNYFKRRGGATTVLHNEPLLRNRNAKPHMCSDVIRYGGTPVVIYRGVEYLLPDWERLLEAMRGRGERLAGRVLNVVKDPEVYVRGSVRHPDHATLILNGWHRVHANAEMRSENLSFYD
jgi:hypothetical protein